MDITYTKHGDFFYPDLTLPPQPTGDIGRFGRMRKKYLKEHQPDTLALMLMENTLSQLRTPPRQITSTGEIEQSFR